MKIIDLLNKIANDEEMPTRVRYKNDIYKAEYNRIYKKNYYKIDDDNSNKLLLCEITSVTQLEDEVEIIEDKKIEKLSFGDVSGTPKRATENDIIEKINEIIEVINGRD